MRKLKLFFACLLMAVLSIGQVWGAPDESVTFSAQGYSNQQAVSSYNGTDFSIAFDKGTNSNAPKYFTSGSAIRAYGGNTFTVSSSTKTIAKIELGFGNSDGSNAITTDVNTYDNGTWTGSATSITFTIGGTSGNRRLASVAVTYEEGGDTPSTPTCAAPTFDPEDGEKFDESIDVEINAEDGATIYYTTDGNAPTTSSSVYSTALHFTETTTLKAMAVKAGSNNSAVATATYKKMVTVPGYAIDFESELDAYVDWTFSNIGVRNSITAHGGSNYASNVNSNGNGVGSASITTNAKVATPGVLTFYVSKESGNNKTSAWTVYVSEDNSDWTEVESFTDWLSDNAGGTWHKETVDLSDYTNVYVSIDYSGSTAIRAIDDIELEMASSVAKPEISGEEDFLTSTVVTLTCATDGATIYYTTDGSDPKESTTTGTSFNLTETATVRAIAKKGSDWSAEADSKTFTKATVYSTADGLRTAQLTSSDKDVWVNLQNWKVTHVSGNYVYIIDQTNEGVVLNQANHGYTAGDVLNDATVKIKARLNAGRVQLSGFTSTNISATTGSVSIGEVTDFSTLEADHQSRLVTLKNATYSSSAGTFSDGEHLIYYYDQFSANPVLVDGKNYDVTGIVIYYKTTNAEKIEIAPRTSGDVVPNEVIVIPTATDLADLKTKAKGTYILTLTDAVVTYVNGNNAFIEEGEAGALIYFEGHGYSAGDALNGDYQVTTEDFNGKFEITAMTPQAGATTTPGQTIPEALLTIAQLNENFATYESRRVKIKGVTVTNPLIASSNDRQGTISDGANTFALYAGIKNTINAAYNAYINIVGYPGFNNTDQQLTIWENDDIFVYSDPELAWSEDEADAFIGVTTTFPELTNDHNVAVTYSSTETDYATISNEAGHEGEITLVAAGETVIKATFAGDETYKPVVVSYTLNVYNPTNPGTITYEENGGSTVADVTTPVDNFPDPLPTPTKENNIFAGWWTTSTFNDGTEAVAGAPMDGNVTLYAKWTEIPVWALTYTSNVEMSYAGTGSKDSVIISGNKYVAYKAGSGSNIGTIKVKLPYQTHTLHFHALAWNGKSSSISISGVSNASVTSFDLTADAGANGSTGKYTLNNNPVDQYFEVTFDAVDDEEGVELVFSKSSGDNRFIIYGVNQEGGIVPVLDRIEISGDLTTKSGYKTGDDLDLDGLTVEAIYTLGGVEQTPVDITNEQGLTLTYDPLVVDQTEVTITASYEDKSDNIVITLDEAVISGEPEILTDVASRSWTSVDQYTTPATKAVAVTLKNVAAATATLAGDDVFSIDKTDLVNGDVITISVINTETAGDFAATITISDKATENPAADKVVNLSLKVVEAELPETPVSTDSKWVAATDADLVDGAEVLITGVKDEVTYAMGGQNKNNRAAVAASVDGEDVLTPGENTMSFTLVAQETEGVFALRTSNGKYLYAAANGDNHMKTQDDVNANAKWTISATSAVAESSTNRNVMQFNGGSTIFSCYSSDSQTDIQFYVPKQDTPVEPTSEDVRTELEINRYYTICLPKNVTAATGATFWSLTNCNAAKTEVYLEEAGLPEAGKPYIFQATAATLNVVYGDQSEDAPVANGALRGTFEDLDADALAAKAAHVYILIQNTIAPAGGENSLKANRAYIDYDVLTSGYPAPGRRVRTLPLQGQTATGCENIQAGEAPVKMMIDGQLFILRGEKMYDATGRLVK